MLQTTNFAIFLTHFHSKLDNAQEAQIAKTKLEVLERIAKKRTNFNSFCFVQGILMFKDQYRALMQYSLPRDGRPGEPPKVLHDWICANVNCNSWTFFQSNNIHLDFQCGVQNFRRRDQCFKCGGPKSDIDATGEGADEVSPHPTTSKLLFNFLKIDFKNLFLAVLLRGLDALSTEDSVLNCLMQLTNLPIKSIRIGKDSLTNTSRGVCYVEMNSVVDAMFLHNQLLGEPPTIDDKLVSVSYYRPPPSGSSNAAMQAQLLASNASKDQPTAAANAALAAAQWSHQGRQGIANQYSHDDIEKMAEYSASLYAKTASEKAHYLEYYRNYYKNGGMDANAGGKPSPSEPEVGKSKDTSNAKVLVGGIEYPRYPTPDISKYTFDEASGYHYDATTQLYYDSHSQYYFDSKVNKYVYWSPEHHTYLPAPESNTDSKAKAEKTETKDKVKTAKKIAKDMEKWAKTLNQKKVQNPVSTPSNSASASTPHQSDSKQLVSNSRSNSSEDVAFSMFQNKSESEGSLAKLTGYGSDSPTEDDGGSINAAEEQQFTDWAKLACLLCKRQFPSRDKLTK